MRRQPDEDFTEFVQAYSTRLLRFAEMLCGDRHQAEDIVQHALMRCYPKWRRIDGEPLAYVRRAIVNRFMSQARREQLLVAQDIDEALEKLDRAAGASERKMVW